MNQNQTKRIGDFASTIFILILLAGILAFYYFKYVPDRKAAFNRNAFLELSQIETALQSKSKAYRDAFQNIFPQGKVDPTLLLQFNFKPVKGGHIDFDDHIMPGFFNLNDTTRRWDLIYRVFDIDNNGKTDTVGTLSKDVDTLMSGLVSTYRDIFDGYLLIQDVQPPADSELKTDKPVDKWERSKAKIIYRSADLSMNYPINPDSLLKRNRGLSQMNILDITIEGNLYKLFVYPFEMYDQKLALTGLISDSNYREANQKIPFSFFSVFMMLLLLLVIHLPILRIYALGPDERIRAGDIRMIIGSYFVAAFFGFFLFTKAFLNKEESIQNEKNLSTLSDKITANLYEELDSINRQLFFFDHTLDSLCWKHDTAHLNAMCGTPKDTATIHFLNRLFKPLIYPYPTVVFWISDSGKWVARWAFRKTQTKSQMIDVKDRSYYTDFKSGKTFSLPGEKDTFTLQPTLSKTEGEYIITVAKKSRVNPYPIYFKKDSCVDIKPLLIGLSSRMHSVSNVILPPGFGFSMIDVDGNILFDSKAGRPLLSNILKEVEDPGGIQQSAIYRNRRYFEHLLLRSKDMALLSTPVSGTPYQMLVYFNRFRSDGFQEHLIALTAGLILIVICLVIFSGLINQWSKTKNRMLESRAQHFEWLHPSSDPLKQKYYRHLIRWMILLLAIYLMAWLVMDAWLPGSEFSLLFLSLLFPFYVTLHYYELRERYYDVHEHRTGINWYFSRPSLALRGMILFIIIIINCFVPFYRFSNSMALPVLIIQLFWAATIAVSAFKFRKYMKEANDLDMLAGNETHQIKYKIPIAYIWSILIGVILISVIPASGIFWLFFRQETGLYQNADQLTIANQIDQRRHCINEYLKDYKFKKTNATDSSNISDLKFSHGIYMLSGWSHAGDKGISCSPIHYPSADYIHLHELLIPSDSIGWTAPADTAADKSWYFGKESIKVNADPSLVFSDQRDELSPTPFHLTADSTASWNTAGLMAHSFSGAGPAFPIFFIVGLGLSLTIAYFLTLSLTKRIFLMELQIVAGLAKTKDNLADNYYALKGNRRNILLMMFKTCKKLQISSLQPSQTKIPYTDPLFPGLRDIYHFEKKLPMSMMEALMPWLVKTMEPVYSTLWNSLTPRQKFILFDFAQDGFANYKAGKDLQELMEKGLVFFEDLRLCVMTVSFQEYVLQQKDDKDLRTFFESSTKENTWKKIRTPLLILLTAIGIFIFVTQDAVYQKITGLLATLTSLLPLLSNMFNKPPVKTGGG